MRFLPRRGEKLGGAILKDWAVDGLVRVMSAPPIDVTVRSFPPMLGPFGTQAEIVPGQTFWIADSTQTQRECIEPGCLHSPTGGSEWKPSQECAAKPLFDQPDRYRAATAF